MPVARDRPAVPDGHRDSLPFSAPNYLDLRTGGIGGGPGGHRATFHLRFSGRMLRREKLEKLSPWLSSFAIRPWRFRGVGVTVLVFLTNCR